MGDQAHIIVVDDEAELREMLEEFLTRRGFAVSTAEGGAALRRAIQGRQADLVLLDINMPGEDGLSLARWLRQETRPAIIMLTAVSDVVDRIVGLEVGADDYLTKPFDLRAGPPQASTASALAPASAAWAAASLAIGTR